MKVTLKFYNKQETESFSLTLEDDQIVLRSKYGVRFVTSDELFDLFNEAYHNKMLEME